MGLPQLTGVLLLLAAGPAHADRVVVIGQVPPPGAGQGRHELLDTADLVPADAGRRAERAEQARALAEGGRRAFTEARFAEAVTLLARARDAIVEIGFEGSSPDDLAQVSLVLGLAQAVTGDEVGADQSVRLALRLRPDLPLDPERFGPPARRRVERLRAEVDDARIPRVVTTEPIGAAIEIDGRPAGATPCTVELSLGPHVVLARASGRPAR